VKTPRLVILVLCIAAAPVVCGQGPGKKTLTKPPFDDTKIINTATSFPLATVPSLYGMNRTEAGRFLESLRLRAIFSGVENGVVVAQKPPGGTNLRTGSGVAVILGGLPQVVLTGPAAPAFAGSDLTFTTMLVPPVPEGVQVTYNFQWNDGTPTVPTKSAVVTHRFADAARRVVSVVVVINDRVQVAGRIPVEIVAAPPPTDTTPKSETNATTTTVAPTETQTTATTQTTTIPPAGTAPPTTTTPTTTTAQTTTVPETPPKAPAQTALLLIGVIAILLLLTIAGLLVRLLRKMNRTPPAPAASPLVIKGGPGSVEYEIEHPEHIRHAPTVQVRGGIRAGEGDDDA
jgi:hypothetical protein